MSCKHKFGRLNDSTIFCERCGETRVVAAPTWPVYNPIYVYPVVYPIYWPAYPYYTQWTLSAGTTTIQVGEHT